MVNEKMVNHIMHISPDDNFLLSVVCLEPTASELERINQLLPQVEDWERVVRLLLKQGSAPLLHVKLPKLTNAALIPAGYRSFLQQAYYKSLTRGMLLYASFDEVIEALQGMDVLVLKGAYLSEHLYKDIALRQFSDLDLLVHEADGLRALAALQAIGFSPRASKPVSKFVEMHSDVVHYAPMERGEVSVEIHIKLHSPNKQYQLSMADIWQRSQAVTIHQKAVRVMSTDDLLIHLCVHAYKHFMEGEIQLKSFNDLVNLLRTLPTSYNWIALEQLCVQYGCADIVFGYLLLTHKHYPAPLPAWIASKYASSLASATEERFVNYVQGKTYVSTEEKSAVPGHINSLKALKNPLLIIRYLYEVIFPSKAFMVEKYELGKVCSEQFAVCSEENIDCKLNTANCKLKFWWLWYGYRWWVGLKGVLKR